MSPVINDKETSDEEGIDYGLHMTVCPPSPCESPHADMFQTISVANKYVTAVLEKPLGS